MSVFASGDADALSDSPTRAPVFGISGCLRRFYWVATIGNKSPAMASGRDR